MKPYLEIWNLCLPRYPYGIIAHAVQVTTLIGISYSGDIVLSLGEWINLRDCLLKQTHILQLLKWFKPISLLQP